jgi:hypothetical protein
LAAHQDLAVRAAVDTGLAVEPVEAGAAIQPVVTGPAEHPVGVELPVHDVVATAAVDDVAAGQRLNEVGAVIAEQGVALVAGGKPLLGQGQGPVVAAVDEVVATVPRDAIATTTLRSCAGSSGLP